jgi:serine/threonine protein kinase
MPFHSIAHLVQEIGRYRLLDASQMEELKRTLVPAFADPRDLIREIMQRGWLTPFQANKLAADKAQDLILGSYTLLERLSEGMMGERYQARHQHMRRMVTLQIIRADLLEKSEAVQRFYEEIQATGQLTSPHIVAAYDAGPIGPTHFFAMEYVDGTDIERMVLESGPLTVRPETGQLAGARTARQRGRPSAAREA